MDLSTASKIGSELLLILAILFVNGLFSMSELAVVSARRARLQKDADNGDSRARTVLKLLDEPTVFLSTIQLGVTLMSIVAGAVGASTLAATIAALMARLGMSVALAHNIAFLLTVLFITLLSVVIGELVPKRLALASPEPIAKVCAPIVRLMARLFAPLVILLERSTEVLLRGLVSPQKDAPPVTEQDIRYLIDQGSKFGVIEKGEGRIVGKVLRLGDRPASSLMTPRNDLQWIDITDPIEEVWRQVSESRHSYFPVAEGSIENLLGIVSAKDVARYVIERRTEGLQSIISEPLRISSFSTALQVIEQFKNSKRHIALVLDEHSGLDGMITTHDLAEALVGDLADTDSEGPECVRRADGSLLVDASMEINELFSLLGLQERVQYQDEGYHSLGGFVYRQLNHIPATGERFEFSGYVFEVVDLDRHRVDKVIVSRVQTPESVPSGAPD